MVKCKCGSYEILRIQHPRRIELAIQKGDNWIKTNKFVNLEIKPNEYICSKCNRTWDEEEREG